jgi:hypothetical protein
MSNLKVRRARLSMSIDGSKGMPGSLAGRAASNQPLWRQSTYWSGVTLKSAGSLTPVWWFGQ